MKKILKRMSAILLALVIAFAYLPLLGGQANAETYFSFSQPTAGATFKAGNKVTVKFWAGTQIEHTVFDGWGQPSYTEYEEMPVTLKVFKGNTEIYSQQYTYTKATYILTTFTPKSAGTLKLCIYGCNRGLAKVQELQATTTIKVKKAKASKIKKVKPEITVERTAKNKAKIVCTTDYGYGMKVYRATKKNGKYKLIKKTSKNTFTDKTLKASKTYYYKIKLYAKSGKKTYQSKWSAKTLADKYVDGLSLVKVSSGVKIKWKAVSGTGYYLIRRSTKGVPGEDDVISCEGGETTEYIDTEVQKGKTYYYSVTSYKDGDESVQKVYNAKIAY